MVEEMRSDMVKGMTSANLKGIRSDKVTKTMDLLGLRK